jgi:hypothetical protein
LVRSTLAEYKYVCGNKLPTRCNRCFVFLMCISGNRICLACIVYVYLLYFVLYCTRCICCTLMCICCTSYVYLLYYVCIAVLTLDAGLLTRSQYPEGPATGHLNTGFSRFPCVYKRMLRWFPSSQVATTSLSCSPPDFNFVVTFFFYSYLCTCKITTATG